MIEAEKDEVLIVTNLTDGKLSVQSIRTPMEKEHKANVSASRIAK